MGTVEKRSVALSPELAAAVDHAVAAGEYGNASEVIREVLRRWKERRELYGYTRRGASPPRGRGLDSGPSRHATLADVKAEARRRSEAARR